ncbi:AtpZ/AtpI family protein [bacterium]|nr:AtpZ/AtpI family protein [bacterium]
MSVSPKEPSFSQVLNQATRIISSLLGTIMMFTVIGFGIHHYYPDKKWIIPVCVFIGIVCGFAIMIKEAIMDSPTS